LITKTQSNKKGARAGVPLFYFNPFPGKPSRAEKISIDEKSLG
jgi:hypothetical protein